MTSPDPACSLPSWSKYHSVLDNPRYMLSKSPPFSRSPDIRSVSDDRIRSSAYQRPISPRFLPNYRSDGAQSSLPSSQPFHSTADELLAKAQRGKTETYSGGLVLSSDDRDLKESLELSRMRGEVAAANKTNIDLICILDATRAEKQLMHDELTRLTGRMQALEQSQRSLADTCSPKVACSPDRVTQLAKEVDEYRQSLIAEECARSSADIRVRALEEQNRSLEDAKRSLEARRVPEELQRQRLEDELRASVELIKEMRKTCDGYEKDLSEERARVNKLQSDAATAAADLEMFQRQKNHFVEESNRLQSTLSSERRDMSSYMEEQKSLRSTTRAREEEMRKEIDVLAENGKNLSEQLAEAQKQGEEWKQKCEAKEETVKLLTQKAMNAEKERDELTSTLQHTEERARKAQLEALLVDDINNTGIQLKHDDAVAQIQRVRQESRNLKNANREMSFELEQRSSRSEAIVRRLSGDFSPRRKTAPARAPSLTRPRSVYGEVEPIRVFQPYSRSGSMTPRREAKKGLASRSSEPSRMDRGSQSLKARSRGYAVGRTSGKTEQLQSWKNKALVAIQDLSGELTDLRYKYEQEVEFSQNLQKKMENVSKITKEAMQNCEVEDEDEVANYVDARRTTIPSSK